MKKIFKLTITAIAVLSTLTVSAQQQVMFTQYMFNGLAINPAYAGSQETLTATALLREQWSGLDGAPETQTFSIHSPIRDQKMGLGFLFLHDKIGITNQTGAYGSYAYNISFLNGGKLAMGIQGGFTYFNAKFSTVSSSDPTFTSGDVNEWQPNVGGGLYYSTQRFYAGLSSPQLIQTTFDKNNPDSDSKLVRHYFVSAGYVFDLNENLKLKPNTLIKYVKGAPLEIDLNANLLIKEIVWVGFSWRSFDSIDAILQLQINQRLQVGYAYDFATATEIKRVNSGSHELMLSYRIPVRRDRIVTPRYF
jgi:type IX secretion system PorP/SprF family membrane protein